MKDWSRYFFSERLSVELWEDWTDLFGDCNWYDMTLVDLSGEHASYSSRTEVCAAIIGLHIRVTWRWSDNDTESEVVERVLDRFARDGDGTPR